MASEPRSATAADPGSATGAVPRTTSARTRFTSARTRAMPESVFAHMDAAKAAARAAGRDVIDLSIGSSDLAPPPEALAALRDATADPATYGYCLATGSRPLREAAVRWHRERFGDPPDGALDPDAHALQLIGSQEGLAHLLWAVADPGDAVLLPDPAYPSYFGAVAVAGLEAIALPLHAANGFLPDLDAVDPGDADRARALVLNYPNNPTAGVADEAFFDRAVAFCRRHGLLLIHDFPYVDTVDGEACAPSVLARPGALEVAIELYSASKSFHMGGFRIGWALGHPEAIAALARVKGAVDFNAYLGVQRAAVAALGRPRSAARRDALVFAARRAALASALGEIGWPLTAPPAGMYLWARIPAAAGALAADSLAFCDALVRDTGVALAPGRGFGPNGEGYVRFALVRDADALREAARRVGAFLARFS
jgi:aspartate/methionine/tyrosine aminotransferase